jgi:hypothetical protein
MARSPLFYFVINTILAVLLALYGPDIRRWLEVRPSRARSWWRSGVLAQYQRQLAELKQLHNNTYGLLLFAVTEVARAGSYSVWFLFFGPLATLIMMREQQGAPSERMQVMTMFASAIPGLIAGVFCAYIK